MSPSAAPTRRLPRPSASERSAYERMYRTMLVALGLGTLLLVAANLPNILSSFDRYAAWWTAATVGGMVACAVALLAAVRFAPLAALRVLCLALALLVAVGLALGPLAVIPGSRLTGLPVWLFDVSVLGATAFAGAFRPLGAWIGASAISVLLFVTGIGQAVAEQTVQPVLVATSDTFFQFVCFAIALATLRAGRLLDQRAAAAVAQARTAATTSARAIEDARLHALLHDHVLSTLLAYAQSGPEAPSVARSATQALEALDGVERPPAVADLDERAALWALQAVVTEVAPTAAFRVEGEPDPHRRIPIEALEALREATREALRNSARHAASGDREVTRLVRVSHGAPGLRVRIVDDGQGFDPARVEEARLGLRVSILGRMQGIPGGGARVLSRRGRGTLVDLEWAPA